MIHRIVLPTKKNLNINKLEQLCLAEELNPKTVSAVDPEVDLEPANVPRTARAVSAVDPEVDLEPANVPSAVDPEVDLDPSLAGANVPSLVGASAVSAVDPEVDPEPANVPSLVDVSAVSAVDPDPSLVDVSAVRAVDPEVDPDLHSPNMSSTDLPKQN